MINCALDLLLHRFGGISQTVGCGLLVAEQEFRKIIGYRQIPLLLSAMANAVSQKPVARKLQSLSL